MAGSRFHVAAGLGAALACGLPTAALGATYWVSPTGHDSASGAADAPWLTLQMAADTMAPGDTTFVLDGVYEEKVTVSRGGTGDDARIVFESSNLHGARCTGFVITGDFVTVSGFEVEADMEALVGILVSGSEGVKIHDCFVHDCPQGGIVVTHGASGAEVIGNLMQHNGQVGLKIAGSGILVQSNEVSWTVQHHPKGELPDFTGYDADGMRIFGDHHVIRLNHIHDIADPADTEHNIDPHADCIQTWDGPPTGTDRIMTDTLIEGNRCSIANPSGKGIIMESTRGNYCHHITIASNVIEFRDEGISAVSGLFSDILVLNNVFKANLDDASWGVSVYMRDVTGYSVQNNIMLDCHAESRKIEGGSGVVDYNLVYHSNGAMPSGTPAAQEHELWGVDPLLVGYTGAHGGDYHLLAGSPAIDAGALLDMVTLDLDGVPRPQGVTHDIGAYEWTAQSEPDPVDPGGEPVADLPPDADTDVSTDAARDAPADAPTDETTDPKTGERGGCGCRVVLA